MRRGSTGSAGILKALIPGEELDSQVDRSGTASVDPDPGRIHPLLPTVNYAWDHPNEVYSDHLPRGGEWKPLAKAPSLQFRSWNVMGNGVSGFDKDSEGDFIRDEEGKKEKQEARFKRIATTVSTWTTGEDKDRVDFIALQEVSNPRLMLKELGLLDKKDADWGYTFVRTTHTLTLYRKSVLTPDSKNSTDFRYKDQPIQIHNTYMGHRNFPGEHQAEVQKKLTDDKPSIVLGDFNCRFAPTLKSASSLFTVVTSKFFRFLGKQGGDHIDAALVRDDKGISQLETWVIDPVTGNKYEAPPPDVARGSSVDPDLVAERKRYSPVMEESWMKPTLDDVRKKVKQEYNISVFMAFNNEKDPKIALQFEDRFLYALYKALSLDDKPICYDYPQGANIKLKKDNESCVFIDHPQLSQFQEKIALAYKEMSEIKKMFLQGTNFSIIPNPRPGVLSLKITQPGEPEILFDVDKTIKDRLISYTTKPDITEGGPQRSAHL